ncbi:hypothetical protein SAMN05421837_105551 [Amycolatopsis pretoriensis]|uniref:Uncharacterized protein n=1 Tax=Amycolatopsis pretoriensis TaxID=218821 RepID=A0A1H5QY36_9PSEU|nr:DUF5666 domain-containing protein [Amycolatopsis pretoriensis]SEF31030.1 hypothetical protein SAMN05421837_105551 [Amycolatopsis pretoriensis]
MTTKPPLSRESADQGAELSRESSAEEIVASPAVEGDLNAEMRRAAKPFSRTTLVLAGLVVLAIAFGGGAWTHAAFGSSSTSTPTRPSGAQGGTQGGTGQTGGTGQGGFRGAGGGRGTTGTVDHVDGTTVYVKTAQGQDVKVSTSDSTTVGVTQQGKLSDLKPGATVTVQGQAGEDGTVTAQAITQQAAR